MKKIDWINILERAFWTFLEGFLVALPATGAAGMDGAAWKSALIGASFARSSAKVRFNASRTKG